MADAGGYWRPLAAVARLLEELAELAELQDDAPLPGELADLWIITTALADQVLATVAEPGADAAEAGSLAALVAAAGAIGRVVNHYDGPKVPRGAIPSLADAVAAFHRTLSAFARDRGVELARAVAEKLDEIRERGDIERFSRRNFDPSAAPVLTRVAGAGLPERLWGGPDLDLTAGAAARAAATREHLVTFAKAARAERLAGFVIAGPEIVAAAGREAWIGALVAALEPAGDQSCFSVAGVELRASALLDSGGRVTALIVPL